MAKRGCEFHGSAGRSGARPTEGVKKVADRGIDGRLYFHEDNSGKSKQVIFSVKAARTSGSPRRTEGDEEICGVQGDLSG